MDQLNLFTKILLGSALAVVSVVNFQTSEVFQRAHAELDPTVGSAPHHLRKDSGEIEIQGTIKVRGVSQTEYPKLAKVSSSAAVQEASRMVHGRVNSVSLENEDGYLVYNVEIVHSTTGLHEVLVDAGNGKFLSDESKDLERAKKKSNHESDDDSDGNDRDGDDD